MEQQPDPAMSPDMGMGMPQDNSMQMPPQDNMNGGAPMPPMDGGADGSEYDTNFDAGVEADEDEDPKKYIQQLTGKLSQELNTYNNENDDEELSKYVGKMIIKAAAKSMDEKGRKDLIKAIKTVDTAVDDDDDEDLDMDNGNGADIDAEGMEDDNMQQPQPQQDGGQPMNERRFRKCDAGRILETFSKPIEDDEKTDNTVKKYNKNGKKTPFLPKMFHK